MPKKAAQKYKAFNILSEVSRIVSSSLELNRVASLVLKESRKALGADHASLFLLDEKTGRLSLIQADGFSEDEMDNIKLLGSWEVINRQLIKGRHSLIINNVSRNPIFRSMEVPFSHERI